MLVCTCPGVERVERSFWVQQGWHECHVHATHASSEGLRGYRFSGGTIDRGALSTWGGGGGVAGMMYVLHTLPTPGLGIAGADERAWDVCWPLRILWRVNNRASLLVIWGQRSGKSVSNLASIVKALTAWSTKFYFFWEKSGWEKSVTKFPRTCVVPRDEIFFLKFTVYTAIESGERLYYYLVYAFFLPRNRPLGSLFLLAFRKRVGECRRRGFRSDY